MFDKTVVRRELIRTRDGLPAEYRQEESRLICDRILESNEFRDAGLILTYSAIKSEVDVSEVNLASLCKGSKLLAFPVVTGSDMEYRLVSSLSQLTSGAFGVKAPGIDCRRLDEAKLSKYSVLALFPGCGFSRRMERMGYGKGYYDKYFYRLKDFRNIKKAGVCFREQIVDMLPAEEWDVRLDMLFSNL